MWCRLVIGLKIGSVEKDERDEKVNKHKNRDCHNLIAKHNKHDKDLNQCSIIHMVYI